MPLIVAVSLQESNLADYVPYYEFNPDLRKM
jgi:hypothetical protein